MKASVFAAAILVPAVAWAGQQPASQMAGVAQRTEIRKNASKRSRYRAMLRRRITVGPSLATRIEPAIAPAEE